MVLQERQDHWGLRASEGRQPLPELQELDHLIDLVEVQAVAGAPVARGTSVVLVVTAVIVV